MNIEIISEIWTDNDRINVKPIKKSFEFIWRDASGIAWDDSKKLLHNKEMKEWNYYNWFQQIIFATLSEYGCLLIVTSNTNYRNISDELKNEIIMFYNNKYPDYIKLKMHRKILNLIYKKFLS
jgi:hypothetical protein